MSERNSVIEFSLKSKMIPLMSIAEGEALHPFAKQTSKHSKEFIEMIISTGANIKVAKNPMVVLARMETKSVDLNIVIARPNNTFGAHIWSYMVVIDTPIRIINDWSGRTGRTALPLVEKAKLMTRNSFIPWLANVYVGRYFSAKRPEDRTLYIITQLCAQNQNAQSLVIPSAIPENVLSSDTGVKAFMSQLVYALYVAWVNEQVFDLLYFTTFEHRDMTTFIANRDFVKWIDGLGGNSEVDGYDFTIFKGNALQTKWSPILLPTSILRKKKTGETFSVYMEGIARTIGFAGVYNGSAFSSSFTSSVCSSDLVWQGN